MTALRICLLDIPANDIANILARLSRRPYITQEVIFGYGEPIIPAEYVGNGDVQEFRYTTTLRDTFLNGSIASLRDLENRGGLEACHHAITLCEIFTTHFKLLFNIRLGSR